MGYGRLGLSRDDLFSMSWFEFNCAVDGYFDHVKLMLGIEEKKELPEVSDEEREKLKQTSEKWMKFFKRPTLKTDKWLT